MITECKSLKNFESGLGSQANGRKRVVSMMWRNRKEVSMQSEQLKSQYERKKLDIGRRMKEFRDFGQNASKDDLFAEVAYCICTPQTPFEGCQRAVKQLQENKLLFSGDEDVIAFFLHRNRVRFHNVKGKRIAQARAKLYENGCPNPILKLVRELLSMPERQARDHLYEVWIPGLGMKECSHFLRNIGHGENLAILDRHILWKLESHGVINQQPKTLSAKNYQIIEQEMSAWSNKIGIPLGELDLLLWSEETGEIFK